MHLALLVGVEGTWQGVRTGTDNEGVYPQAIKHEWAHWTLQGEGLTLGVVPPTPAMGTSRCALVDMLDDRGDSHVVKLLGWFGIGFFPAVEAFEGGLYAVCF